MKYTTCLVLVLVGCGGDQFSPEAALTHDSDAFSPSGGEDGGSHQSGGVGGLGGDAGDAGGRVSSGDAEPGDSEGTSSDAGGMPGTDGDPGGCSTSEARCVDAQRQTCVGGLWLDNGAPCPGWCIDGACVECEPGTRSCASDTQPRTCDASGSWAFDAACSGDKPWCAEGSCFGLCCVTGAFQTYCGSSGSWHAIFSCTDSVTTGDCTNLDQCALGWTCISPSGTGSVRACQ